MSEAHVINFPDKPDTGGEKEGQDGYRVMSIVRKKMGDASTFRLSARTAVPK